MELIDLKKLMDDGAAEITRLQLRVHETFKRRGVNDQGRMEWQSACSEFHSRYNELAFPGGCEGAAERILNGDALAMEAAVCFLEHRPYFFRSGYMFERILRKAKRAPLTLEQSRRLNAVILRQQEWRARKAKIKNG
jgi:hypothetical protein